MRLPEHEERAILLEKKSAEFTFDNMVKYFRQTIAGFPDRRTGSNSRYRIEDVALAAFSVFFTQSPSFLSFQSAMQQTKGKNNAQSLFGITQIPCNKHIRDLMDEVSPSHVTPVFTYVFDGLEKSGHLDPFRSYNDNLLLAFDGTQYFSSNQIHCENCNQKKHTNGTVTYSHAVVTPVIVAPGNNKVIALQPEFITPQDGHDKQDCENAAAKRWIDKYGPIFKAHGITILGDDLYCKQPICSLLSDQGLDFILVCKPDSHTTLYQWLEDLDAMKAIDTVVEKRWTGKTHEIDTYRFANQLPLRDGEDAIQVNWCELTTRLPDGKILYKNAFATNFKISKSNVKQLVKDGRARWKVENENNNVLKNRGYNLEHNFGHGKKHLASLLLALNLLAFLFHTVLELMDEKYRLVRAELPTRETFFDDVRALTRYMYFNSWDAMLSFMMRGLEIETSDTS
jgi:hypothetical protein